MQLKEELVCLGVLRTPKQTINPSEMRNSYQPKSEDSIPADCLVYGKQQEPRSILRGSGL